MRRFIPSVESVFSLVWLSMCLVYFIKVQWPADPGRAVFTVRPIQEHCNIAISMMADGETLRFKPDGKLHYWSDGVINFGPLNEVAFDGGGTMWCFSEDDVKLFHFNCDVLVTNGGFGVHFASGTALRVIIK